MLDWCFRIFFLFRLFDRLSSILTRLLGSSNARRPLLLGVLTSGDRSLIHFAVSRLSADADSLRYAADAYFESTPAFGTGELNEQLGALCLSFITPAKYDAPYEAIKFLSRCDSAVVPPSYREFRATPDKTEIFTAALGRLQEQPTVDGTGKELLRAGGYFGLDEAQTKRSYLRAMLDGGAKCAEARALAVAWFEDILKTPEPSAWREVASWHAAKPQLAALFPGTDLPRLRLTLARFAVAHAVIMASSADYSRLVTQLGETTAEVLAAEQKTSLHHQFPHIPPLYLSPLDPTPLKSSSPSSSISSDLLSAFLSESHSVSADTLAESWLRDCVNALDQDVGLVYALGPPRVVLHKKMKGWTKSLAQSLGGDDRETYRLLAVSVSAAAARSLDPSAVNLVASLNRLAEKQSRVAEWRSRAIVRGLVHEPDRFFSDAAFRRAELVRLSAENSLETRLLVAKHSAESKSQLVLANLTEIIFPREDQSPEISKQHLNEISPFLGRDMQLEELAAYLEDVVESRLTEIPLWRLLLALEVMSAVAGLDDLSLQIRNTPIKQHISLLHTVSHLETAVYVACFDAIKGAQSKDEFLAVIQSILKSRTDAEGLVAMLHQMHTPFPIDDAAVYASYASHVLKASAMPVQVCIDECLEAIATSPDVLTDWVSQNLFGEVTLPTVDIEGRLELVDWAVRLSAQR